MRLSLTLVVFAAILVVVSADAQVYNPSAGVANFSTVSGDCTATAGGAFTCTTLNGTGPGAFFSSTDAANLTGTVPASALSVTDTTKTTNYPVAASDMGQVLNLGGSGATLTLSAKAAGLWQPGQTLSIVNTGTGAWTLTNSTTLTGAGLTTTLEPGAAATLVANTNGTHLDCLGCQQVASTSHSVGWIAGTNPDDAPLFVADKPMVVVSIVARIGALTGAAATVSVYKAASGVACAAGTIQHSGSVNANSGANTNQTLTLAGGTDNNLSAGDSLCLDTTGTWTSGTGVITATVRPR